MTRIREMRESCLRTNDRARALGQVLPPLTETKIDDCRFSARAHKPGHDVAPTEISMTFDASAVHQLDGFRPTENGRAALCRAQETRSGCRLLSLLRRAWHRRCASRGHGQSDRGIAEDYAAAAECLA